MPSMFSKRCRHSTLLLALTMLAVFGLSATAFGQATSITSLGYRATEGGGGAITAAWTTGNLGNTWAEGEWVPYQLLITDVQNDYPNLDSFPDILMSYDFTSKDNRFVDLVRGIQAGTIALVDGQGWPMDDGSAYPDATRPELEDAQNDVGNTDPLDNEWTGFQLLNLPNSQVNRGPDGISQGTPTDAEHTFRITKADLVAAGIPLTADTIVIYYQLHESRSFVWANSLQEQYDQYPTDDWGGYLYSLDGFPADARNGSGYVPGSSGHIEVEFAGGAKTVPIPIPERLPGAVSGLKWHDQNGDGVINPAETTLANWRIYVTGSLEGIDFATDTVTGSDGAYSFPNLTSNVTWSVFEESQSSSGWTQTYPSIADSVGVGYGFDFGYSGDTAAYGWKVALTRDFPDQDSMNFGNMLCEISITCPPDDTVDCNGSTDPSVTGYPTVVSNCGANDTTYSDNVVPGDCDVDGYLSYIERTWIVTDVAGMADTCTQYIYVTDTTPPVISGVGADDTIECPNTPVFSNPTTSDDCSDVTLTYVDSTTPGDCPQEYSVKRTWTAVDECGNSSTASQTITVEDNTPPVISGVGDDATIECPNEPVFSTPSASDACGWAGLTYVDTTTPGDCPQEFSVKRTWTAVDSCGNSSTASQTITVEDNTPPVISGVGDDATIECPNEPVFSTPSASDACGWAGLTYVDTTTPGDCPQEFSVKRTWTAVDSCGNSSTASQTITVEDNTPPVISGVGGDATIDCPDTPVFSTPSASDACGWAGLTYVDDTTDGDCPQEYSITRTWTAVDSCGNQSTADQTINVEDNTPPVITCPSDVDVNCDQTVDFGQATAVDACDPSPSVDYSDDTLSTTCPLQISRTWTATDACGNESSCVQSIIIRDETPPVISGVGADATVECPNEPTFSTPTATDNCGTPTMSFADDTTAGDCPQEYSITRTWIAVDVCDNADTASQTINVVDNTPPVISGVGDDATVECPNAPVFSTPSASDACGWAGLTYVDDTTAGDCPQEYSITRTWTAVDSCGNESTADQTINVQDNTPPVISGVGDDATIECPNTPSFSNPSASDACGWAGLSFVDDTTQGDCPAEYSITRTWTAVDSCGNSAQASQTINVEDTTGPTITCADPDTIACEDELVFTPPTASDACDPSPEIILVGTDTTEGPGMGEFTYTRSWYAVDSCGNASDTCSQSILRERCAEACTFTIGGWGSGCPESQAGDPMSTQPGCIRDYYFDYVFPGGYVEIGDASGYTARWTSAAAVEAFLPDGGTPSVLTGNLVNPTSTPANVLASQVLGLRLNVEYSCAGVFATVGLSPAAYCYGNEIISDSCGGPFAGLTVNEFLAVANLVVSGQTGVLSGYGATISDVNFTATCLNELHDNCDPFANTVYDELAYQAGVATADGQGAEEVLPTEFALDQNYPNPFNPVTQINFALPQASHVTIEIYNIVGQKVTTLVDAQMAAGYHSVSWNAADNASGVYFYRLTADSFVETRKMVLLK